MTGSLIHRGPDSTGLWQGVSSSFGHTRLSIIDLKNGDQPMRDRDGYTIVFNGEIYNHRELARVLRSDGVELQTSSDTEVILHSYKKWGEKCVDRFKGMFAFVIAEPGETRFFFARDRFGKKPLYYYQGEDLFIFSSEIKAILNHPKVHKKLEINNQSLIDYLSLGYILSPKTIFSQIRQLMPASTAIFKPSEGKLCVSKYWSLADSFRQDKHRGSSEKILEDLESHILSATNHRVRADVPVGAFLSSGVDSLMVVSAMKRVGHQDLNAFTLGFTENSFDESARAIRSAQALDVDIEQENFNSMSNTEVSKLAWHLDQPFSDNSAHPTFQLSRLAATKRKVALSGDGADELFAGYDTYRADRYFDLYRRFPNQLQNVISAVSAHIKPSYNKVSIDYKLRQFVQASGLSKARAHFWWRVIFAEHWINSILDHDVLTDVGDYSPFDTFKSHFNQVKDLPFAEQSLYVDIQTWLPDDILVKVDRTSMAHSLEVRCPFLDHELAEFSARIPIRDKSNFRQGKIILRRLLNKWDLRGYASRGKKGFNAPHLRNYAPRLPNDSRFKRSINLDSKREDLTFKSNNLLMLNMWFDIFHQYKKSGRWEPCVYGN